MLRLLIPLIITAVIVFILLLLSQHHKRKTMQAVTATIIAILGLLIYNTNSATPISTGIATELTITNTKFQETPTNYVVSGTLRNASENINISEVGMELHLSKCVNTDREADCPEYTLHKRFLKHIPKKSTKIFTVSFEKTPEIISNLVAYNPANAVQAPIEWEIIVSSSSSYQ